MRASPEEIVERLSEGSWRGFPDARRYIQGAGSRAQIRALARAVEKADLAARPELEARAIRLAVAGSASTDNLRDALTLQLLGRGLFCAQYHAPFAQLSRELRDAQSGLFAHRPDLIVLVTAVSAYLPVGDEIDEAAAARLVDALWRDVAALQKRFTGPIAVCNWLAPEARPTGVLDNRQRPGVADFYRHANLLLSQRCAGASGVFVVDLAHLATSASLAWTTLHKSFFLASHQIPDELTTPLAGEVAAIGASLKGFAKKCIVVDLDNTLWGGVVGEDGVAGIQIGGGFPGNVHVAFQRQILELHQRGILLAIASKNNPADVWNVFASRPEMVLRREHFSSAAIDWTDKATGLRRIADEIGIGLDSLVLFDDSPVEREWVETALPQVHVAPADTPLEMLRFLSTCRLFDNLTVSREDALRAKSYAGAMERERQRVASDDLETFLGSLELVVAVGRPGAARLGRVAQLTQKTNQFNLTTRRYSEETIAAKDRSPNWEVITCAARDRFADEGLIGVALLDKSDPERWVIDTLLLSCRVLGRGIERAFLAWICERAHMLGARAIRGDFTPTKKNGQTADFYQQNGFAATAHRDDGVSWELSLPAPADMWPSWIQREDFAPMEGTSQRT